MPTVPQRAIFHKAWSDPLAPAENPRSFPIGSNVRITDQALLDRIDSADVAHISANFDLTAPGDIGSGTAGNAWFNNLVVGAAALLAAGSAAAPALAASGDTNTGIYFPAADQVGIAVGGSSGLVVTSAGVGIGTTSPNYTVDVVGSLGVTQGIFYQDTGVVDVEIGSSVNTDVPITLSIPAADWTFGIDNSNAQALVFSNSTALGTNDRLAITQSGNVGIGTTSPTNKFSISGTTGTDATSSLVSSVDFNTTSNQYLSFTLGHAGTAAHSQIALSSYAGGDNGNRLQISSEGSIGFHAGGISVSNIPDVVINSSGQVGIGTASPTAKLTTVTSGTGISAAGDEVARFISNGGTSFNASIGLVSGNTASTRVLFGDSDDVDVGYIDYRHGSDSLVLGVNASDRLAITSTGNVGIGTTSPARLLHVNSSSTNEVVRLTTNKSFALAEFIDSSAVNVSVGTALGDFVVRTGGANQLQYDTSASTWILRTGGTESMRLTTTGFGLGTTSPSNPLHIYRNNAALGAALQLEQDGTGDTSITWTLTGTRAYSAGIDNSDGDKFKISGNADLGLDTIFTLYAADNSASFAGNVGIGTTTPQGSLSVVGAGRIVTIGDSGTANTPVLKSRNSADTGWAFMRYAAYRHEFHRDGDVLALQIENSGDVKFFDDGGSSIGMIWDSSTNRLGIGTTSPADIVEARGAMRASDSTSQYIRFDPTPATSGYTFITSLTNSGIEQVGNSAGRPFIWKLGASEVFSLTSTTGSTGGSGSAGAGNQYVELSLNGQRYKLLHDGTI